LLTSFNVIGLLCVVVNTAWAYDPSPAGQPSGRIQCLIDKLASTNAAPDTGSPHIFAEGYDRNAQVCVYLAIQQLLREGSLSFDLLVRHFDDQRYSHTAEFPAEYGNRTVGATCEIIMRDTVLFYERDIDMFTDEQTDVPLHSQELRVWWRNHRNDPLWKIQADAVEEELQILKAIEFSKAVGVRSPQGVTKPQRGDFEMRRTKDIDILQRLLAAIVATHKPYFPTTIDAPYDAMIGLPWPTEQK
jgi:hypothetical protein